MKIDPRLEKISPLWHAKILRCRTLRGLLRKTTVQVGLVTQKLDIQQYNGCMVAEPFGFSRVYMKDMDCNCKTCSHISAHVVDGPHNPEQKNALEDFQELIAKFCDHVEKDHGVSLS